MNVDPVFNITQPSLQEKLTPPEKIAVGKLSITNANTNYPWLQTKKITHTLLQHSSLSIKQIQLIIEYLRNHLDLLVQSTRYINEAMHLRPSQTGLPVPIEISKKGTVFLPLKNWGDKLGNGKFRKTKLSIVLSESDIPLVAHSTEHFCYLKKKNYANRELRILNKIAYFLKAYPKARGLLCYYDYVDYKPKKTNMQTSEGYSELESCVEINEKRGIATKLYNQGNLKDCLSKLSLENRAKVAVYLLEGLTYLHFLGIFHSDIKLDNIFIDLDLSTNQLVEAVIGDYGFACDLTLPNDCFFKNSYYSCQAPELESSISPGDPIDKQILACDVYSMGLVLKELFSDFTHPILAKLIGRMLAVNPQDRPSAQQARQMYVHFYQMSFRENLTHAFKDKMPINSYVS